MTLYEVHFNAYGVAYVVADTAAAAEAAVVKKYPPTEIEDSPTYVTLIKRLTGAVILP